MVDKKRIVVYGIGTETERLLPELDVRYDVIGLLDGFRQDGEIYGKKIISLDKAMSCGTEQIIVIARPGSCKAISKRIGDMCRDNGIELFDIRGKNLLEETRTVYDFTEVKGYTKTELLQAASKADIVSFDLFDTLVARNIASSANVLELVETVLADKGIYIPNFNRIRFVVEKDLSKGAAPRLELIYRKVLERTGFTKIDASELAHLEYEVDRSLLCPRTEMLEIIKQIKDMGKEVCITSESYYSLEQIRQILDDNQIQDIDKVFVSCEYNSGKLSGLYGEVKKYADNRKILHIGDDLTADVEMAQRYGIEAFHIYSCLELLDALGGLKLENKIETLADKIKLGMFNAKIFNSPFQFEDSDQKIHVDNSSDLGYLFCAPMIFDFVVWFGEQVKKNNISDILFCARDGYLLKRFYSKIYPESNPHYFLTSRISAIRAGVQNEEDIEFVDSMKFNGTTEENLRVRFGIDALSIQPDEVNERESGLKKYSKAILNAAKQKKANNLKYIEKSGLKPGKAAMFDFVAKGTSQMYIQRLLEQEVQGLYFVQLEPEFMRDKGLNIIPFYTEAEREQSAIFDNYYILETMLTSPDPSVDEYDEAGNAVFAAETRSQKDIDCFMSAQDGIAAYVDTFMRICPRGSISVNKALDEAMLVLLHSVQIRDKDFLSLKVEDPFFNRMTDISDVL